MKHCAKKLLGLAFALALCLAVGGTAFAAQAPEFADVPAALPEQEMLDYEPNVTAEPGTNTIDKLATEGYQVTIPTTVTVDSEKNEKTLTVNARLKQYRTLNIGVASKNSWKLAYDGATGADMPKVDYTLNGDGEIDNTYFWQYNTDTPSKPQLIFAVGQPSAGTSGADALAWYEDITAELSVNVPTPSQATMSGTYSDTLTFTFGLVKHCVTYTINVYEQKLELTNSGAHVQAANVVDANGDVTDPASVPKETYVLEYGCANAWGMPLANATTHETWMRPRPAGTDGEEDTRCWEDLSRTLTPKADFDENVKAQTINLNLVRKWYWLDVNGATDYAGGSNEESNGNQGGSISGCVNMQVSVDGNDWTPWFWQSDGDDYWGQFPYGIHFKLGLHHVKDSYVYEMSGTGVRIIANKQDTVTKPGAEETGTAGYTTTYYVYEDTLTGEPTGKDLYNNVRYCYIPCYKKGITYFANEGTGGREDVNEDNPPRTNVPYDENGKLKTPAELDIHAPAGKTFAGWSTSADYPTTGELYKPNQNVSDVHWETYTTAEMGTRPTGDNQKRELYAIWETPYTVKVQFGGAEGWTDWDEVNQSFPENKQHNDLFDYPVTLGTAYTYDNTSLTLSETENKTVWDKLQTKITEKTREIAPYARSEDVWQLKDAYTITELPANREVIIKIKRKRYLLNVIPALQNNDGTYTPAPDATEAEKYGIFDLDSCDVLQTPGGRVSSYQSMRNYGSSYRIYNVKANDRYRFVGFRVIQNHYPVDKSGPSYSEELTGKNTGISYFKDGINTYDGDTIYVMFKKDTVTFDYNGGTDPNGKTELVLNYDDSIRFPQVMLTHTTAGVNFVGWSTERNPGRGDKIFKLGSEGGVVLPGQTMVSDMVTTWPNENNKVLYAVWSSTTSPSHAPAKKKVLTLRYHANFDPNEALALDLDPNPLLEDMDDDFGFEPDPLTEDVLDPLEETVKTVTYKSGEDVVLRNCMFKRDGYVFVGWNTEPDGTGTLYRVNGVPRTDWAVGDTVDLYAQWKKPEHLKAVVDSEPSVPAHPATPPERVDDGFDDAFGADPAAQPEGLDDAFGVDPADQPKALDDAFGVDPADQPKALDDAFGIDPDPQPEELDDAFGV